MVGDTFHINLRGKCHWFSPSNTLDKDSWFTCFPHEQKDPIQEQQKTTEEGVREATPRPLSRECPRPREVSNASLWWKHLCMVFPNWISKESPCLCHSFHPITTAMLLNCLVLLFCLCWLSWNSVDKQVRGTNYIAKNMEAIKAVMPPEAAPEQDNSSQHQNFGKVPP